MRRGARRRREEAAESAAEQPAPFGDACDPAPDPARAATGGQGGASGRAGLDWAGLMRAGLRGLGLTPDQFWALTPAELAMMLGVEFGGGGMTRSRLDDLLRRFPDS